MKIIVGLGNPGNKYEHTRHNAGFLALDHILKGLETIHCQSKFASQICEIHFAATKTFFVKPQTFMNNSGEAVREILHFYKARPREDLLVVHDEVDLPFGTFKLATDSGAAGHNGVQSIIDALGTKEFRRLRIGVESRTSRTELPTDAFVLHNFSVDELSLLNKDIFPKISKEVQAFINKK